MLFDLDTRTKVETRAARELLPFPLPDVSHCGCPLPPGSWGTNGWHHARYNRRRLVAKAERDWKERYGDLVDFKYAVEYYDHYVGDSFAYEQCPAYVAQVRKGIEQNKARKAAAAPKTYEQA